jgi:lipopolysaccharide export system protein LptC
MAWFGRGNRHSTLVALAKILLPLTALAVLSTLFFVSPGATPDETIPYADSASGDLSDSQRLTGATFAGMTQDGAALTLKADEATPGTPGTDLSGSAKGLTGLIETPDGASTTVTGAAGVLDQKSNTVTLSGGVTVKNSTGLSMQTEALTMTLDRTRLESAGAVSAQAPFGHIEAGKLLMTRAADGTYMLDFTGGVRLIYQPATAGPASP